MLQFSLFLWLAILRFFVRAVYASEAEGECSATGGDANCTPQGQRVALVTGSNRGIGLEVVSGLLSSLPSNVDVLLTGRDEDAVLAAVRCLRQRHYDEGHGNTCCRGHNAGQQPCEHGSWFYKDAGPGAKYGQAGADRLRHHVLDLADEESVLTLAEHVRHTYGGVQVLVNNGAAPSSAKPGEHIAVDHFGHLALTKALAPLLQPGARVVYVGSEMGSLRGFGASLRTRLLSDTLTEDELNSMLRQYLALAADGRQTDAGWPGGSGYAVAKAANGAMTRIWAREASLRAPDANGLLVNACCPGPANSPHCQKGAHVIVHLATLPAEDSRTGRWFVDRGWAGQPWEVDW